MSTRVWRQRLEDILSAVEEIMSFCAEMSFNAFLNDPKTLKAIVADLAIVGEAARAARRHGQLTSIGRTCSTLSMR